MHGRMEGSSALVVFEVGAHAAVEPFLPVVVQELPEHLKSAVHMSFTLSVSLAWNSIGELLPSPTPSSG
eukprot:3275177-Pleurochrysis_carterae.AAC.4